MVSILPISHIHVHVYIIHEAPVYKITVGHLSISDHFTETTAQIVAWSVSSHKSAKLYFRYMALAVLAESFSECAFLAPRTWMGT